MNNNLLSEKLVYNGDEFGATRIRLVSYNSAGIKESVSAAPFVSVSDLASDAVHWMRVNGLQDTEGIFALCAAFGVDFLVVQDILNIDHPSKVEEYAGFNFVVAKHFADDRITHVCLIQGRNFVMSFADCEAAIFDGVMKALTDNVLKIRTRSSDYLLTVLLNTLVSGYASVASCLDNELDELELELISSTDDRGSGARIQNLRRRYMDLKSAVLPLKGQYIRLLRTDSGLVRNATRPFFNDVNDHLLYVLQSLDGCRETLSSLMDLYISNNNLRMTDIMKRLTVVSTIFIPLTFLVGVWGMNFDFMPELRWRYGYLVAWVIMIVTATAVVVVFRSKRWR